MKIEQAACLFPCGKKYVKILLKCLKEIRDHMPEYFKFIVISCQSKLGLT